MENYVQDNGKRIFLFISFFLFIASSLYGLSGMGHDWLQDWDYLRKPGESYYIDDSGIHTYGSAIKLYGPWKGVPFLCDFLKKIAKSDFWDQGSTVLTLRDLEDPRSIEALMTAGMVNDTAESARLLGRLKAYDAVPILVKLLYDKDINVQIKALEGLRLMGSGDAVPGMVKFGEKILPLINESHFGMSGGAGMMHGEAVLLTDLCESLGWIGDKQAIPFLRKVLYHKFPFDPTQTIRKNAAEGLAMLGDYESADIIASIPDEYEAVRMLKLPVAIERAKALLTGSKTVVEQGIEVDLRGAGIAVALRIFAEMGTKKDIPFLKERMKNMKELGIETVTGGEPPFGYGNYMLNSKTIPVLFAWALASIGDREGYSLLDRYLGSDDIVIAAEAARAFVILEKTDRYEKIAEVFRREVGRKSYDGDEYEEEYGIYDYSIRARTDMNRMLALQQTDTALRLLVKTHNDTNIHAVYASRRAIKTYPGDKAIKELVKQYSMAGEQEVFQIATMLEILGPSGMEELYRIATSAQAPHRRAVAMRAVIRYEYKNWRELITYAAKQNNEPMRELIAWTSYRFQLVEPDIVDNLRDPDFQFDSDDIPKEITSTPADFFHALKTNDIRRAWSLLTSGSRDAILEFAGTNYLDIDYFTINNYFEKNDPIIKKVWRSFFSRININTWAKNSFTFKKYESNETVILTADPARIEIRLLKEQNKWRFDLKDFARKLGIDLFDYSFLKNSVLADGLLKEGDTIVVNWDGELFQAIILEAAGSRYYVHYIGYDDYYDEWIEKRQIEYEY